jgi:hypothetical protein
MFLKNFISSFFPKVETMISISSDQLANQLGIPVIVARERYFLHHKT